MVIPMQERELELSARIQTAAGEVDSLQQSLAGHQSTLQAHLVAGRFDDADTTREAVRETTTALRLAEEYLASLNAAQKTLNLQRQREEQEVLLGEVSTQRDAAAAEAERLVREVIEPAALALAEGLNSANRAEASANMLEERAAELRVALGQEAAVRYRPEASSAVRTLLGERPMLTRIAEHLGNGFRL